VDWCLLCCLRLYCLSSEVLVTRCHQHQLHYKKRQIFFNLEEMIIKDSIIVSDFGINVFLFAGTHRLHFCTPILISKMLYMSSVPLALGYIFQI
jgi:hypothetical protein